MTYFWIISLALCVLAAILSLLPWFQRKKLESSAAKASSAERTRANVRIHKERLRELASEKSAGLISEEQFEALKQELEANLLTDAQIEQVDDLVPANRATMFGLTFASVVIVATSVLLYTQWGAYDLVQQHHASRFSDAELSSAQAMAESGDTRGLLVQLRDKLRNAPGNIEGWSLLANTAMNAQMFDIAIEAYNNLLTLESDDEARAALFGLKAQALYFNGSPLDSNEVGQARASAFELNPDETNTLGLLAIASFEKGDFKSAVTYWERILDVFPEHPSKDSIKLGISAAKRELNDSEIAVAPKVASESSVENVSQDQGKGGIAVSLEISDALLAKLAGSEQLVVFAKATQGPPMPLAVARYVPRDAPGIINLDDSLAMMPELKLSAFQSVDITARITSGSVTRAVGDYEVVVEGVLVGTHGPTVVNVKMDEANLVLAE